MTTTFKGGWFNKLLFLLRKGWLDFYEEHSVLCFLYTLCVLFFGMETLASLLTLHLARLIFFGVLFALTAGVSLKIAWARRPK